MIRVYVDTNVDASVLLLVDASTKIADLKKQVERHIAQEYSGVPVGAGEQKIERMNCLFDPISPSRSRENCFTVPDGYDVGSIATDGTAKLFAEYRHAAPATGGAFVTPVVVPGDKKRGRVLPPVTSNGVEKEKKMKKTDAKETPAGNAREKLERVQKVSELCTNVEPVAESGGLQRTPSSKTLKNQKKREQRKRRRESAKKTLEEEKPVSNDDIQKEGKPKEKTQGPKANGNENVASDKLKSTTARSVDHVKKAKVGQQSPKKVTAVGKGEETGKTSFKKKEQTLGDTVAHKKPDSSSLSSSSSESSSSSSEEDVEPVELPKAKSKPMAEPKKKVPEIPKKGKIKVLPTPKAPVTTNHDFPSSSSSSESKSSSDSEDEPVEPPKVKPITVSEQKKKEKAVPKKTEKKIKEVSKKTTNIAGKSKIPEVLPEAKLSSSSSSSSESSESSSSSSDSEDEPVEVPNKKGKTQVFKEKAKEKEVPKMKKAKHVAKPTPPLVATKDPSSSESSSSSSDSEEIIPKSNADQKPLGKPGKAGKKPEAVMGSKKKQVQESSSDTSTSEDNSTSDSASSSSSSDSESDSDLEKEGGKQILTPSGKFDESDGRILKHLLASASHPDASKVCVADLRNSAQLEQEQDDLKKKLESESQTYQWQKPFSSFSRESLLKLCRMMVRDAVNQERKARGLEEVHAAKVYKDENRPDWWPLHNFRASSFDKKKDAVAVYNATRKILSAIYRVDLQH